MDRFKAITLWGLRLILAGLFVYAGAVKAMNPDDFLRDVESYRLLPYQAALGVVLYLPWLEIIAGVALLVPAWSRASAALLAGVMMVFLVALVSAWARGLDISCGCFGKSEAEANYSWLVIRDCLLLAALVMIGKLSSAAHSASDSSMREQPHPPSIPLNPKAS